MNQHLSQLVEKFDPRDSESIVRLVEGIATNPPTAPGDVARAFSPFFRHGGYDVGAVFPALLSSLAEPSLAAAILDLANHLTRQERVTRHPAAERTGQLIALLGGIVERLARLEEQPFESGESAVEIAAKVSESVALAVSLCDALAQIGDQAAIGKLNQALQLAHRRLRTEAAAALARLGEKSGRQALIQLAVEPVARLRVLAYAEELGLLDQIEPQYASAVARAEAELVVWLAEPTQFGFPPSELELVDSRSMYWPGYDEPVECFLFRYGYRLGESHFSNVGIAGPASHALIADLTDLPPDDIYAAYAGWHAEHDEIRETDVVELNESQMVDVARLERRLRDAGYEAIVPQTLGTFFGDRVLVAQAAHEGAPGLAVVDAEDVMWRPVHVSRRPLGPTEMYCLYKGRRLLRTFNATE